MKFLCEVYLTFMKTLEPDFVMNVVVVEVILHVPIAMKKMLFNQFFGVIIWLHVR